MSSIRCLLKAQMQNKYEKMRCELYLEEIVKDHVQKLYTIDKSITDVQTHLRNIKITSGYYKDSHGTCDTASQKNRFQVPQSSQNILQGAAQQLDLAELNSQGQNRSEKQVSKKLTCHKQDFSFNIQHQRDYRNTSPQLINASKMKCILDSVNQNVLTPALKNDQNKRDEPKNLSNVENIGNDIKNTWEKDTKYIKNLKMTEGEAATLLPGEDNLMQTGNRNVRGMKGERQHSTVITWDPAVSEYKSHFQESSMEKRNEYILSHLHSGSREAINSNKNITAQYKFGPCHDIEVYQQHVAGQLPIIVHKSIQRDKIKQDFDQQHKHFNRTEHEKEYTRTVSILKKTSGKSIEPINYDNVPVKVLTRSIRRVQSAPLHGTASRPQGKSAPALFHKSQGQIIDVAEKSSRGKNASSNRPAKDEMIVAVSKRERKRILQELISNCNPVFDRTLLEKERQKLLHNRITAFLASLIEESDNDQTHSSSDN